MQNHPGRHDKTSHVLQWFVLKLQLKNNHAIPPRSCWQPGLFGHFRAIITWRNKSINMKKSESHLDHLPRREEIFCAEYFWPFVTRTKHSRDVYTYFPAVRRVCLTATTQKQLRKIVIRNPETRFRIIHVMFMDYFILCRRIKGRCLLVNCNVHLFHLSCPTGEHNRLCSHSEM